MLEVEFVVEEEKLPKTSSLKSGEIYRERISANLDTFLTTFEMKCMKVASPLVYFGIISLTG